VVEGTGTHECLWVATHCLLCALEALVEALWTSVERLEVTTVWCGGGSDLWSGCPAIYAGPAFVLSHCGPPWLVGILYHCCVQHACLGTPIYDAALDEELHCLINLQVSELIDGPALGCLLLDTTM